MESNFLVVFLSTIRVSSLMVTSPIFSVRQIPSHFKFCLSLLIGILMSGTIKAVNIDLPSNNIDFLLTVFKEILVGGSIGMLANFLFNSIRMSAQIMDFQVGFSMAQYYDPATSGNSTPIERFLNWFSIVVFLTLNFHHVLITAVMKSINVIPIGVFSINPITFKFLVDTFIEGFYIALQLAAPIVIILFITDFTIGLIARTVPQINVFILGMPAKVLVGLLSLSAILPGLLKIYIKAFDGITPDIMELFNKLPFLLLLGTDDKTEEPTHKKLQDAKKKGQVPKSTDLNSGIILFGVSLVLILFGELIYKGAHTFLIDSFNFITKNDIGISDITVIFIYMLKNALIAALPIMLTVMLIGVITNIGQTGFLTVENALSPKLERINPIEGFKRIFNKRSIFELLKSITKIVLISYVAFKFIKTKIFDILKTSDLNPYKLFYFVKDIIDSQLIRLAFVSMLIGLLDFIYQKRKHKKELRMTKQEIKEEFKQSEGDPQLKSRIRQKQRDMAMRRMMHEVPKATVVITNPTHFAVALKYERSGDKAPMVIAKGADIVAKRIKEIAKENDVPIVENKFIARTLYSKVELEQEIPMELYQAIAEIIAYVYNIRKI